MLCQRGYQTLQKMCTTARADEWTPYQYPKLSLHVWLNLYTGCHRTAGERWQTDTLYPLYRPIVDKLCGGIHYKIKQAKNMRLLRASAVQPDCCPTGQDHLDYGHSAGKLWA